MAEKTLHVIRRRAFDVVLVQPSELAEVLVGLVCFVVGMVNLAVGAPWASSGGALLGAVLLALFGPAQIAAAIHGELRLRHAANLAGMFATVANLLPAVEAGQAGPIVFSGAMFVVCTFLLVRTQLLRSVDHARRDRLSRGSR